MGFSFGYGFKRRSYIFYQKGRNFFSTQWAGGVVLLSDIDGLYDGDPRKAPADNPARFISEVSGPDDLAGVTAGRGSHLGTGGMVSKLSSALLAADAGVPVLLAAAADAAVALSDASVGTVFAPRPTRMSARRF